LDGRARQAQEEEKKLSDPNQTKRAEEVKSYITENSNTKVVLAKKHEEFKTAVKSGDYFKANAIKTDVHSLLGKEQERYSSQILSGRMAFDSKGNPIPIPRIVYLLTSRLGAQTPASRSKKRPSVVRRSRR
jgi:hypothetical protein